MNQVRPANGLPINNPTEPFQLIRQRTISGAPQKGGFVDNSFVAGGNLLRTGFDVGVKVTKIILGFLGLVGGAVAAAIFKENTAADWGSKVLMIAGAILGFLGVKDLLDYKKTAGNNIPSELCYTEVGLETSRKCNSAISELRQYEHDPNFATKYDPNKLGTIRLNKADVATRTAALKLLEAYLSPELVKHAGTYKAGVEYQITNIDPDNVSLPELGDRIVQLLGYISASGSNEEHLVKEVLADVENRFNLSFDYDKNGKGYARMLPTDFRNAYVAAKWYNQIHRNNNGSANTVIGDQSKIDLLNQCLTMTEVGPAHQNTYDYLSKVYDAQNYLSTLEKVIGYVRSAENLTDPIKARNVIILRQALICGFGIKGDSAEKINEELEKILLGVQSGNEGLTTKLKVVSDHLNSQNVSTIINDPQQRFPFQVKPSHITDDDVLRGITWYEVTKKIA